jgi:UDP-3-O-[3-hydroxymyristoyl] glucosamine N-acyltransferase
MKLSLIAEKLGAKLIANGQTETEIITLAPITSAKPGELTFLANPEYQKYLPECQASAIIVDRAFDNVKIPQLVVKNPYAGFARAAMMFWKPSHPHKGVSSSAFIDPTAKVPTDAIVFPTAFIAASAKIGQRAVIYPGCFVGANAVIGDDVCLYPNVYIGERVHVGHRVIIHAGSVLGADGFGFAPDENEIVKIPQVGTVVIEDDVEIGAVCTIDRAALKETRIRRGTKLDSKVHIAHNVEVGENCMFSALTGIAGSTKIGNWVMMGGHSGASGHLTIPDKVKVGAMSGVVREGCVEGETYMGFPAIPAGEWRRAQVYQKRLPQMEKDLKAMREVVKDLQTRLERAESKVHES